MEQERREVTHLNHAQPGLCRCPWGGGVVPGIERRLGGRGRGARSGMEGRGGTGLEGTGHRVGDVRCVDPKETDSLRLFR